MKTVLSLALLLVIAGSALAELHPIVEVESGYLLGATSKGQWIKAERAAKELKAATTYRLYSLTDALGEAKGRPPKSIEEPCPDVLSVELPAKPEKGVIALAAPWNAQPRKPKLQDITQEVYVDAAREYLKGRGIKEPVVRLKRIVRVDLNGDGEDEVLLSATNYGQNDDEVPTGAKRGDYSFVLLRRVVAGKVQTQLIAGEFYAKATTFSAPNYYEIAAVLDLDGDGTMEVVVHSGYYEGGETTIYSCAGDKIKTLLSVGCGA